MQNNPITIHNDIDASTLRMKHIIISKINKLLTKNINTDNLIQYVSDMNNLSDSSQIKEQVSILRDLFKDSMYQYDLLRIIVIDINELIKILSTKNKKLDIRHNIGYVPPIARKHIPLVIKQSVIDKVLREMYPDL